MDCKEHSWEPNPNWHGRYRCRNCGAFGYRKSVTNIYKSNQIVPYVCSVNGCSNPAKGKDGPNRVWRCKDHRMK